MGTEESQLLEGKKLNNDVWISWRKLERCPYQPREGQSCAVSGQSIFFFGGVVCSTGKGHTQRQASHDYETNQLLKFDFGKNVWEEVVTSGDAPEPRSGSTLTAVGNKLYMFGGLSENHGWLNDFYSFDIETKRWLKLHNLKGYAPSPRDKLASCALGSSIFLFGGFGPEVIADDHVDSHVEGDDGSENIDIQDLEQVQMGAKFTWFNSIHRFDTNSDQWSTLSAVPSGDSSCPSPRAAHSMCVCGNNLIVFGGRDAVGRQNDIWSFAYDTCKWTELQPAGHQPQPRSFHAAVAVGNRMVVHGGRGITNVHFSDTVIYDTEKNLWIQPSVKREVIPPPMGMHSLVSVDTHIVLCFGTSDLDPSTNSCATYHQDCYAVATGSVLSDGPIAAEEEMC